jgi:membrane protease YdiL (CAAX protease family)
MLLTSLVFGWVHDFGLDYDLAWDPEQLRLLLNHMLTLELVDTLLVGVVLYWMGRPSALARPPVPRRLATWAAAVPLLLVALAVNFGYHFLLREFLAVPPWKDELVAWSGLSAWIWLAYCVQPAVVEELFFRYLALGTLRGYMGVHGAVLISSVMFGMAHIGMPLSIPLLTGIGVVFGYVRVASGSLLLPILMHFGHNAAILLLEAWL